MNMSSSENRYYNADKLITHNAVYEFILSVRNKGKRFIFRSLKQENTKAKRKGRAMVTMYKKDRKYRKWKWNISPSRFFDVFIVDANGGRHYVNTYAYRHRAQKHKAQIETDGGNAIIIGRA